MSAKRNKTTSQASVGIERLEEKPCWRINGVWGNENPRCEKLKFVGHCRNCDVFEDAARAAIVEGSEEFSNTGDSSLSFDDLVQQQRLSGDRSILPFRIEESCFAVPAKKIITVHDHIPIHSIPFNRNSVIKGVVAINHEIFSFVNIVELLSLPPAEKIASKNVIRGRYKRVLVVSIESRTIAFNVDEVYPIFRYYRQAVNKEIPGSFLQSLTKGRLLKENDWCDDCHILDLDSLSNEFENTFL